MRKYYKKPNNLNQLHEEILAAGIAPHIVEGLNDDIWITHNDFTVINTIVNNHVKGKSRSELAQERKEAIRRKLRNRMATIAEIQEFLENL